MTEPACSKCKGPRTWLDHSYCRDCNNAYRRKRMQHPAARAAKQVNDWQTLRRRKGLPADPRQRYWEGA